MGRYDSHHAKNSGRYNTSRNKEGNGINLFVVIILVIASAAGGYFAKGFIDRQLQTDTPPLTIPLAIKQPDKLKPEAEHLPSDEEALKNPAAQNDGLEVLPATEQLALLPALDSSDPQFRAAMLQASPNLEPWLDTGQLIRKYLTIANDFSQGQRSAKHVEFLKLTQPFTAEETDTGPSISAAGYQRYTPLAQAVDALDVNATLGVYKKFKPLLQQVYTEFGYPENHNLEDIFLKAAAEILAAPVFDEPVAILKSSSRYKFADPQLEALNPVHKQMLRMGPENTRIIQNKVRMLVEGLDNVKD